MYENKLNFLGCALSRIDIKWQNLFIAESEAQLKQIDSKLAEISKQDIIFPPASQIFDAFLYTSFDELSVVVVGQDPYHGDGEANGLAFSVNKNIKLPPSLRNIFVELEQEYKVNMRNFDGELLIEWAKQGVLLLNSSLTVIKDMPNSLSNIGWAEFTDKIISHVSKVKKNIVFILWGGFAYKKIKLIDPQKHLVLTSAHPSPLSSYRGFFGCNHFILANRYLQEYQKHQINWTKNG